LFRRVFHTLNLHRIAFVFSDKPPLIRDQYLVLSRSSEKLPE